LSEALEEFYSKGIATESALQLLVFFSRLGTVDIDAAKLAA
jgi:hypothetical protein